MYHYLSDPPPRADRYRRDLSVSPAQFEEQLAYLKADGYQAISLYDLLYHLTLGWPLPEHPIIITFDDGYRDNYTSAFPLCASMVSQRHSSCYRGDRSRHSRHT